MGQVAAHSTRAISRPRGSELRFAMTAPLPWVLSMVRGCWRSARTTHFRRPFYKPQWPPPRPPA